MKHCKKIVSLVLAATMALPMGMSALAADASDFKDIPGDWSKPALEAAISNGLLAGDNGLVKPEDNLTRAQMAAIVNRAFAALDKADITDFSDVATTAWYHDDMAKAVQMKTFAGYDNQLNPEKAITRQEAFSVLARAFQLTADNIDALAEYQDSASVADWAKNSMAAMVSAGYVSGANGQLNPTSNISRKEFAQVMYTMVKSYITTAGTYTEVPEKGNVMINAQDVTLKDVTVNGDLVIGDGVGNGDVTLDNVVVTGRVIVRGAGVNSLIVKGNSKCASVIIAKVTGNVRLAVDSSVKVEAVTVADGKDNIIIDGEMDNLLVTTGANVLVRNAKMVSVEIPAGNGVVTVEEKGDVNRINIKGNDSRVIIKKDATASNVVVDKDAHNAVVEVEGKAETVTVNGDNATIQGNGTVTAVNVEGNNAKINTKNTKVTVEENASGTTVGGKAVEAGSSVTTPATTNEPPASNTTSSGTSGRSSSYRVRVVIPKVGDKNGYEATASSSSNTSIKVFAGKLVDTLLAQAEAQKENHDAGAIAELTQLKSMLDNLDKNNDNVKQWLSKITSISETGTYEYTTLEALEDELIKDYNAGMSFSSFRAKYGTLTIEIAKRTVTISTTIS